MPRKLRFQYRGAMYRVMNRGDQQEAIFQDEEHRQRFLAMLGEACQNELRGRAKGHPGKVVIARRVRQETTLSLRWIAERLAMGTWTHVSNLLNQKAVLSPAQEVLPLCQ